MHHLTSAAVLATALCLLGCASPTPALDDSNSWTVGLRINADPGNYHEFFSEVRPPAGGTDTTVVRIKFKKVQPSDKWAPTTLVCLQGSDPDKDRTCLQLAATIDDAVILNRWDRTGGEANRGVPQRLTQKYRLIDELIVQVEATSTTSRFLINGESIFESSTLNPIRLVLSCSSALCNFDMR